MNFFANIGNLIAAAKKYAPVVIAVAAGVGSIAAGNYAGGLQSLLHAVALIAGGAAVVQLHQAVAAVPTRTLEAASRHD